VKRSTKESIDIDPSSCPICESPLRAEIEQLDSLGKEPKTIKWARQKGLNISKFSLIKHRVNHLQPINPGDNGNNGNVNDSTSEALASGLDESQTSQPIQAEARPKRKSAVERTSRKRIKADKPVESQTADNAVPIVAPEKIDATKSISDQLLLDAVRDRVYQKLINNEIELDLGDGFKAIEIKHKIAEESQNEKLLLEILKEIRAEELKK
jgi:flagellar biosynthesis GTPase FlhF